MKRKGEYGIFGSEVYLKVLEGGDLEKVFRWKNDYELVKLIKSHPFPSAKYEIEEWFKKNQSDKNQILLGIYNLKSKSIIGLLRLMFIDWVSGVAELGIFIGEKTQRGKGIGKEVLKLTLDFAFTDINLHRIHLKVTESNTKAIHLYKSYGFIKEGLLRKHFWINGKYKGVLIMGLLKNEYLK